MRLFKILFKLILIVLVLFAFVYDFGFINLDSGFKFALPQKDVLPTVDSSVTSISYTQLPFAKGLNVIIIKGTAGNAISYKVTDAKVDELKAQAKDNNIAINYNQTPNALLYIAVLFGILMIPTKKIQKIKKIKNSRR